MNLSWSLVRKGIYNLVVFFTHVFLTVEQIREVEQLFRINVIRFTGGPTYAHVILSELKEIPIN